MLSSYLPTMRSLQRQVWLYFAVMALTGFTVDGGIFSVVFNLFLLRLGYGPEFVGQINSAGLFAFALCSLPSGTLGVWLGNRRAMIVGMALMMVSCFALALSEFVTGTTQTYWLLGFYIVFHSSIAILFVNTAPFLMAVTQETHRSHAFALQSAMLSSAAFAGSLIGGLLPGFFARQMELPLDAATPYRYPLLLAAIMLVFGIILLQRIQDPEGVVVATAVVPPLPPRRTYPSIFRVPRFQPIQWQTMDRAFLTLIIVISLVRIFQIAGSAACVDDAVVVSPLGPSSSGDPFLIECSLLPVAGRLHPDLVGRRSGLYGGDGRLVDPLHLFYDLYHGDGQAGTALFYVRLE